MGIAELAVGIACASIAFLGYFFKYIKDDKKRKMAKAIWLLSLVFVFTLIGLATGWH
jgi:hypothetical protein